MLNKRQTSLTIKIFALIIAVSFVASLVPVFGTRFSGSSSSNMQGMPGMGGTTGSQQTGSPPTKTASKATKVASLIGQGDLNFTRQDYVQAVSFYKQAVALDDGNGMAHGKLGMAYFRAGDTVKARSELDRALELDNEQPEPLFYRAQLAAAAGDEQQARTDYELYLRLEPQGIHAAEAREALKKL